MVKNSTMWVIVANSSFVEIFSVQGKEIQKVELINFPAGRAKYDEIVSDRPGRGFNSVGGNRHAYGTQVDLHSHERSVFAHNIINFLKKAHTEKRFDQLAMIAPPEFLGELRRSMPDYLIMLLRQEIDKDLPESLSETERLDQVHKLLQIPKTPSPSAWNSR